MLLKMKLIRLYKMCTSWTFALKALLFLCFKLAKWRVRFLVNVGITIIEIEQFAKKHRVPHF